jgi:hypothetical protein
MPYRNLAAYKRFETQLTTNWPIFSAKRSAPLRQQGRFGEASQRVAENIVKDLFTIALGWNLGDINNQVDYADIVVTRLGIKYCIVETKRPGALAWNRRTYYISKQTLVSTLLTKFSTQHLRIAKRSRDFDTVISELQNFGMKVTSSMNEVYAGMGTSHDDLAVALMLACTGADLVGSPARIWS